MPNTARTTSQLLALFPDNASGLITPQDIRDFVISTWNNVDYSNLLASNGNGSSLTNLSAGNISSGTLLDARLSSNVFYKDGSNNLARTCTTLSLTATTLNLLGSTGSAANDGGNINVTAGNAAGTGIGGDVILTAGDAATDTGGNVQIFAGSGTTTGGNVLIQGGNGGEATGTVSILNFINDVGIIVHENIDLQGAITFNVNSTIDTNGLFSRYNNINLLNKGIASQVAAVNFAGQSAPVSATTAYTTTYAGYYRLSFAATVTRAATSSSTLGGTNGFRFSYTDADDSIVKKTSTSCFATSAANTTGTAVVGSCVVYAKSGTAIQYLIDYTSSGGTSMQYNYHLVVEAM